MSRVSTHALRARTFRRDALAWIKVALLLAVSIWTLHWWLHRQITITLTGPLTKDARIVVLGYDHIVPTPDGLHVDRETFGRQLAQLQAGGYQAVRLSDIVRFYDKGAPLPAKSVLLTFDRGYLETYESVEPVLERFRWPAAVFLLTERQSDRKGAFLYWDRLQRMVDSGLWEIGTNGHQQLSAPSGRTENQEAEQRLIELDLVESIETIRSHVTPSDVLALSVNRAVRPQVAKVYKTASADRIPLCIVDGLVGFNDSRTVNPCLSRLRVDPSWSPADLVERLERESTAPPLYDVSQEGQITRDVAWEGAGLWNSDALTVTGNRMATVVFPTAQWTQDWILSGKLSIKADRFWLEQINETTGDNWRIGGDETRLYGRYQEDGVSVTVTGDAPPFVADRPYPFRIIKRGGGTWIEWDGDPLFSLPMPHAPDLQTPVRIVAWSPEGDASLTLQSPYFARYPYIVRTISTDPSPSEIGEIARAAGGITSVSPALYIWKNGELQTRPVDRDLFSILRSRYRWEIVPAIRVLDDSAPSQFLDIVRKTERSQIRVDLTSLPALTRDMWIAYLHWQSLDLQPDEREIWVSTTNETVQLLSESGG